MFLSAAAGRKYYREHGIFFFFCQMEAEFFRKTFHQGVRKYNFARHGQFPAMFL